MSEDEDQLRPSALASIPPGQLLRSPEILAKQAFHAGLDAVVALVLRQDDLLKRQARQLQNQADDLAEPDWAFLKAQRDEERARLTASFDEERARLVAERDRLAAELRALRGARGEVPRTSGELRAWREERGLTQVAAAELLGVGHATVERAEVKAADAPLSRVLRLALVRNVDATREAVRAASLVPRLGPGPKRGTSRRR